MKTIVIYNSQTGFTKKYAQWISEVCNCECLDFKQGCKINLFDYDAIVFGGWLAGGMVSKVSWFKKQISKLSEAGKKLIVYAVGASPANADVVPGEIKKNFTDEELAKVKVFYCPGGLNYEKMKPFSRIMMKMYTKGLASKKDATPEEKKRAQILSSSFDISDKKYIEPIITELK